MWVFAIFTRFLLGRMRTDCDEEYCWRGRSRHTGYLNAQYPHHKEKNRRRTDLIMCDHGVDLDMKSDSPGAARQDVVE